MSNSKKSLYCSLKSLNTNILKYISHLDEFIDDFNSFSYSAAKIISCQDSNYEKNNLIKKNKKIKKNTLKRIKSICEILEPIEDINTILSH
jgi:hypothetical protein